MNKICKNCSSELTGKYCSNCGQKDNSGRIQFTDIKEHIFEEVITLDGQFFRTIKELTTQPAELCKSYITGQRKRYTKPLQYYLIMFVLFFLVERMLNFDAIAVQLEATGGSQLDPASLPGQVSAFMSRHLNSLYFIFIVLLAGFSRFLYRKKGYNFSEYVVVGLYVSGHYIFFSLIFVLLSYVDVRFILLVRPFLVLYAVWVLTKLDLEGHIVSRLSKSLLIVIFSYLIFMAISYLLALTIIQLSNAI